MATGKRRDGSKPRHWRWLLWVFAVMAVAGIALWMSREAIAAKVESALIKGLSERGIYLRYAARSWSPWSGLRLREAVLHRDAAGGPAVVEVSALTVDFPWWEILKSRALVTRWRADDATVKLHDPAGGVTFDHVTTAVVKRAETIDIPRLEFRQGGVAAALSGKILLSPDALQASQNAGSFAVDLSVVREVQAVLDFQPDRQPFVIQGTLALNFRAKDAVWQADLAGAGKAVVWQGVPLRDAIVKAQLSAAGMKLTSSLQFTQGTASVSISLANWDRAPVLVAGKFADAKGHADDFAASYDRRAQSALLSSISGPANLWEFARNFPTLAPHLAASVQIETFPDIVVQDVAWSFGGAAPAWTMGSIQTRSPANVSVSIHGEPLKIEALEGGASVEDKVWKLKLKSGHLAWRGLDARAVETDTTLSASRIKSTVSLHLAGGSAALEVSSADGAGGPWAFSGSITDAHGQADRFAGNYELEPAALRIVKLEGRANLLAFTVDFPAMAERIPQDFHVGKFPEIAVKDFLYRPGKPVTFDALRVVSPTDLSVVVRGSPLAIRDLTGTVAFDGKAWRFSQLRGQALGGTFALDGTYEDGALRHAHLIAAHLHLRELKPWLGPAQAALGGAILSLEYTGTICHEPSQLSGTGSIRLENAPVVHVPLLDQTYDLFSALVFEVKRRGMGRITSTFTSSKGVADITQFAASSDAVKVTATGTLDLVHGKISGRARGNLRGLAGIVTSPLSHTLEMELSGSLDNIRVRPTGIGGIFMCKVSSRTVLGAKAVKGTKLTGSIVRDGVALPFRALKLLRQEAASLDPSSPE